MNSLYTNKPKILSPKLDVVFQALFGEVGSESITKRFLEVILNRKIDSIDLSKNPILRREHLESKLAVLDVIAKINNQETCNIEMQVAPKDKIIERILYYWSRIYSKQIQSGNDYNKLQKTIVILISNFSINGLEDLDYHTTWKIIEEKYRKTILTDKLEVCIIELSKIANLQNENNELLDWLFFLENPTSERVIEKMKNNKELKQATKKLEEISQDKHMQRIAEWREKAILDENTARICGYDNGKREGLKEGLKEGLEEGKISEKRKIALALLQKNIDINIISETTGLSIEEIEDLRNTI